MNRLRMMSVLVCGTAVLGTVGAMTPADAARPAAPTAVRAYQTPHTVQLTWTNPRSAFDRVVLRYARGAQAPTRTGQGRPVRLSAHAHSASLAHLAAGTRYAVAIWTRDRAGHLSARATTRFTTPSNAPSTATVTGLITDPSGHPLAHVVVSNIYSPATTRTDARGRFRLSVAPGEFALIVDGTRATGGSSDATGYHGDLLDGTARTGRVTTVRSILDVAGAFTGRVVDPTGRPLAGVQVVARPAGAFVHTNNNLMFEAFIGLTPAMTRADGRFTLRGASAYSSQVCFSTSPTAVGPGGVVQHCLDHPVAVESAHTRGLGTVTVTPDRGGALRVKLVDATGHAVSESLVTGDNGRDGRLEAYTDAKGVARAVGLPAGKYQFCGGRAFTVPAYRPGTLIGCAYAVVRAGSTTDATLRVRTAGAVSGTVRGPNGRGLAGVSVTASTKKDSGVATTDAHGRYVVHNLQAGNYTVCTGGSGAGAGAPTGTRGRCFGAHTKVLVRTGLVRTGIDVALVTASAVAGTVVTHAGRPAKGAGVSVDARSFFGDGGFASTDAKGRFLVGGLAPARYSVCAQYWYADEADTQGCVPARTSGHATAHVGVRLPAVGAVRAVVTDAAGHGLSGADAVLVKKCTPNGDPFGSCQKIGAFDAPGARIVATDMTRVSGEIVLDGVTPGAYALCVLGYDAVSASVATPAGSYADSCTKAGDVTVTADAVTSRTVALSQGALVHGRLTDSAGDPIAGVRVVLQHGSAVDEQFVPGLFDQFRDLAPAQAVTGPDGRYTVRSATPVAQTICFDATFAGTSKRGFLDQCHGGTPGHTNDGTAVPLAAGDNPAVDQVLTSGPPRSPEAAQARSATTRTRAASQRVRVMITADGRRVLVPRVRVDG